MTSGNWMDKKTVSDDVIRTHINELIRDEIQETINEFVDTQDSTKGLGFVSPDDKQELKVNISNKEVDKLIKEYKKIKKAKKSNIAQVKKLGLVDKHGRPLK
tara:strand:- start:196 stop:501 length:306 start_codon:yes stop_codon:yes gene_type:complete